MSSLFAVLLGPLIVALPLIVILALSAPLLVGSILMTPDEELDRERLGFKRLVQVMLSLFLLTMILALLDNFGKIIAMTVGK